MPETSSENTIPSRAQVFPLGPPVDLAYQVGRIGDIDRLVETLRGRDHTVLSDVRRAGKSTVALGALDKLGADTPAPIIVSLDLHERVDSSDLLALEVARQVARQRSRSAEVQAQVERLATRFWRHARDVPVKDLPDSTAALIAEGAKDVLEMISADATGARKVAAALQAAEHLAATRGTQAYVFIDEAQDLTEWADAATLGREFRARLRASGARTTFLFAGSEASMVERMFGRGGLLEFDAPQFQLSPIEDDLARADLRRSFGNLQFDVDDAVLDIVVEAADGRPLRMMLISNKAARITAEAGDNTVDAAIVTQAVQEARRDRFWDQGGPAQ